MKPRKAVNFKKKLFSSSFFNKDDLSAELLDRKNFRQITFQEHLIKIFI